MSQVQSFLGRIFGRVLKWVLVIAGFVIWVFAFYSISRATTDWFTEMFFVCLAWIGYPIAFSVAAFLSKHWRAAREERK